MAEIAEAKYWIGCVDDDPPFLESAGRLIDRAVRQQPLGASCEVELAAGPAQFTEVLQEMDSEGLDLALLITDQIMPGCSGLELIERVKPTHPATSCVLLTGYAGLESARYAINNRLLDRYVCKPIEDPKQFAEVIASELERFHLRRTEALQQEQIRRQTERLREMNVRLEEMKRVAERVAYFSRELRTLDLDEVLDLVCDKAPQLFGAKSCFLFVPDRDNRLILWRERRVRCLAPVPPSLEVNRALREAMVTRKSAVVLRRDWCSGAIDSSCDDLGCVVMPLMLSHRDPAFAHETTALPALLCLCGIEGAENLSRETLEYKVLLVNDILGANIANALAYTETERLASEDSLTGAKTRRAFDELLRAEWERFQRYQSPFCLALMDIDHLKHINDTYGHAAGDEVIRRIAEIADQSSRRCDTVARFGGDEFCLLLPETDLEGAQVVVRRVLEAIGQARFQRMDAPAGVSIGLATAVGKRAPEEVLGSADRALYQAKKQGRGQAVSEPTPEAARTTGRAPTRPKREPENDAPENAPRLHPPAV